MVTFLILVHVNMVVSNSDKKILAKVLPVL